MPEPSDDDALEFVEPAPPASFAIGVLKMLRLPNVFTAAADVLLGYWMLQWTQPYGEPRVLALLVGSSICLYLSGMVWNDVFDAAVDARERPERPIPSGVVGIGFARMFAGALTAVGVALAALVGTPSAVVAVVLASLVLLYDGVAKRSTIAGPLAMGGCRFFNVWLGLSPFLPELLGDRSGVPVLVGDGLTAAYGWIWWTAALGNGIYVAGITVFARDEAGVGRRDRLALGLAIAALGLLVHAWSLSRVANLPGTVWLIGAAAVASVLIRQTVAVVEPSPARIKQGVIAGLTALIMIDAVLLLAVQTKMHAMIVVCLLPASVFLGRWLYRT